MICQYFPTKATGDNATTLGRYQPTLELHKGTIDLRTHRWPMTLDDEKLRSVCTGSFLINDSPKSAEKNEVRKVTTEYIKIHFPGRWFRASDGTKNHHQNIENVTQEVQKFKFLISHTKRFAFLPGMPRAKGKYLPHVLPHLDIFSVTHKGGSEISIASL